MESQRGQTYCALTTLWRVNCIKNVNLKHSQKKDKEKKSESKIIILTSLGFRIIIIIIISNNNKFLSLTSGVLLLPSPHRRHRVLFFTAWYVKSNRFGRSHRVLRAHWAFSSYSSVTQPTAASQSVWLLPHTELWPRRRSRRWTTKKQEGGSEKEKNYLPGTKQCKETGQEPPQVY